MPAADYCQGPPGVRWKNWSDDRVLEPPWLAGHKARPSFVATQAKKLAKSEWTPRPKKKKKNKGRKKRGLASDDPPAPWVPHSSHHRRSPKWFLDLPGSANDTAREHLCEQPSRDNGQAMRIESPISLEGSAQVDETMKGMRKKTVLDEGSPTKLSKASVKTTTGEVGEGWEEFLRQLPRQSKEEFLLQKAREEEEKANKGGENLVEHREERERKKEEENFHWKMMVEPDHRQIRKKCRQEKHSAELLHELLGEDTFDFEITSSQGLLGVRQMAHRVFCGDHLPRL